MSSYLQLISCSVRFLIYPSILLSETATPWRVIAENDASLRPLRRQFGPKSFQLRRHHRCHHRTAVKTSSSYPTWWQWHSLIFGRSSTWLARPSLYRPQSFSLISRSLGPSVSVVPLGGAVWKMGNQCFLHLRHQQLLRLLSIRNRVMMPQLP